MDTQQMIEMAEERVKEKWEFVRLSILGIPTDTIRYTSADGVSGLLLAEVSGDTPAARFIASAPRTILALADEVARLQADNERLQEQARHADKRAAKYEAQMDYVESRNVLLGEWIDGGILPNQEAFYPVLAPAIGYYNQHLKAWLVNLTLQDAAFWKDTPADFPEALSLPAPQPSPDEP